MGMSAHVVGIIEADEKFKQMMKIKNLCQEQGIPPPTEVEEFCNKLEYDGVEETVIDGQAGRTINLGKQTKEWSDDYREGFEIKMSDIPANVKVLRFYNSW